LFPLGGSRLIAEDSEGPDADDEKVQQVLQSKQHRWLFFWRRSNAEPGGPTSPEVLAEQGQLGRAPVLKLQSAKDAADPNAIVTAVGATLESTHKVTQGRAQESHPHLEHVAFQRPNESATGLQGMSHALTPSPAFTLVDLPEDEEYKQAPSPSPPSRVSCFSQLIIRLRTLPRPPTIALVLACPISVIIPLKALFVPLQNANGDPVIRFAPDGAPPLAFILDTATFLGSASVPLALMCLGAALAKLKVPKGIRGLPLGAILSLTMGRLVLQPIIAVAMVGGLVRAGLINEADKVLRFTMM
jgi:predicted permease